MKKFMRLGISFLLLSIFILNYTSATAKNLEKTEVRDAYYAWCSAIGAAKGDSKKVVRFYSKDAILHPTLSSQMLINHQGLNDYFAKLTSHSDIKCKTTKLVTHMHGDVAINSGSYIFSYKDSNDQTVKVPARFSFVYRKYDHEWLIVNHHSSVMP